MPEGSVQTDTGGVPTVSQTPAPAADTSAIKVEGESNTGEVTQETEGSTTEVTQTKTEGQQVTEKGTKLDPDPLTAAHQQLANAQRQLTDFKTVLGSPELLRKFAKEAGYTLEEAKEAIQEEIYSADRLQTGDDVAKALNEVRNSSKSEIDTLKKEVSELKAERNAERIASTMSTDVTAVREKYPALDPKSPSYNPDLEKAVGELFIEVDYDARTKSFRGQYSLQKIADRIMKAAEGGKKQGSQEAQTDKIVKERGKVTTSGKASSGEASESDDPGTAIAQRINKVLKR